MNLGVEGVSVCVLVHVYVHALAFYPRNMNICLFGRLLLNNRERARGISYFFNSRFKECKFLILNVSFLLRLGSLGL